MIVRYGRSVPFKDGFLPVFSVDTEEEARLLLTMACPRNFDGEFYARELVEEQTLENLEKFGDKLELYYNRMLERRRKA